MLASRLDNLTTWKLYIWKTTECEIGKLNIGNLKNETFETWRCLHPWWSFSNKNELALTLLPLNHHPHTTFVWAYGCTNQMSNDPNGWNPNRFCLLFGRWYLGGGNWEEISGEVTYLGSSGIIWHQVGSSGKTLGGARGSLWEVSGKFLGL